MTKRGRDLFELLELRKHGTPARPQKSAPRAPEFVRRAGSWFDGLVASLGRRLPGGGKRKPVTQLKTKSKPKPKPKAKKAKQKKAPAATIQISVPWLAAMLVVAVGAGFMLGRGSDLAAWTDRQEQLRVSAPKPELREPRLLGERSARQGSTDLGLQADVETLSPYFYVVLNYPESEGDRATQLAEHLRGHGLEQARIRYFPKGSDGRPLWSVVVYVPEQASQAEREGVVELLRTVPAPAFERQLSPRQSQPFKLMRL